MFEVDHINEGKGISVEQLQEGISEEAHLDGVCGDVEPTWKVAVEHIQ